MKLLDRVLDLYSRALELWKSTASDARQARIASEETLRAINRRPEPPRYGQLLLLWGPVNWNTAPRAPRDSELAGAPCCASISFEMRCQTGRHYVGLAANTPVPPGAWLVSIGCSMQAVLVGNQVQNLSVGHTNILRLRDQVQLGVLVRVDVILEPLP